MTWWYEPLPGFFLPVTFAYDPARWPDYTTPDVSRLLEMDPELSDVLRLRGWGQPSGRAWATWLRSREADRQVRRGWDELEMIADKMYDSARYVYLVPYWRRAITRIITELDDVQDQLTTILWALETVARKWIPVPPKLLDGLRHVDTSLDCATGILAGATLFRTSKSSYQACLDEADQKRKQGRKKAAGAVAWLQENWGNLLQAAQATGTWFDVGIVLGPIMAWIDEGLWGVASKTVDNYLIAADALLPGYADDFRANAQELYDDVQLAITDTIEAHANFWDYLVDDNYIDPLAAWGIDDVAEPLTMPVVP